MIFCYRSSELRHQTFAVLRPPVAQIMIVSTQWRPEAHSLELLVLNSGAGSSATLHIGSASVGEDLIVFIINILSRRRSWLIIVVCVYSPNTLECRLCTPASQPTSSSNSSSNRPALTRRLWINWPGLTLLTHDPQIYCFVRPLTCHVTDGLTPVVRFDGCSFHWFVGTNFHWCCFCSVQFVNADNCLSDGRPYFLRLIISVYSSFVRIKSNKLLTLLLICLIISTLRQRC